MITILEIPIECCYYTSQFLPVIRISSKEAQQESKYVYKNINNKNSVELMRK